MNNTLKIWFISDIHGSSICFKKFLNSLKSNIHPDVIILGADIAGKYLIPIIQINNNLWEYSIGNDNIVIDSQKELINHKNLLENRGIYYLVCDKDVEIELRNNKEFFNDTFKKLKIERLKEWVTIADERLVKSDKKVIVNCGNDDPLYLDEILDSSKYLIRPEGKTIYLNDKITLISTGVSNITPWNCPRDVSEEKIQEVINEMIVNVPELHNCIFNFHCPPYNTSLDKAPKLDLNLNVSLTGAGVEEISVGSTAVRNAIEKYQPVASLHGHIHESHVFEKIGKTICFNPGSVYYQGLLNGVYLEFNNNLLEKYSLTKEL